MAKFVETRTDTSGRTYYVFNPKKYLREALDIGYRRFDNKQEADDYSQKICLQYDHYKARREGIKRIPEDSVDGLVAYYKTTNEWKKLTINSAKFYDLMIRTASELRLGQAGTPFGEMLYKRVSTSHADRLYTQLKQDFSEHRAVHVLKVLRKIWYVGKRHSKVTTNPFERMGVAGLDSRVVLWEPQQVERFMAKADEMGFSSIGTMALMCYDLCQRPSDMRQLRWSDLKEGVLRFNQQKTGTLVEIPASQRLLDRLEKHANGKENIIVAETTGRPYDRRLYNKWVARVRTAAGLPNDLQLRDLRRTGATEMAEAGCTEDELRSVTGHQSRDVLSIYVRPTVRLAASGVNKRFAGLKKA